MAKIKRFIVSHALINDLFSFENIIGPVKVVNGLPRDATICRILSDPVMDASIFIVSSSEFEDVPEGAVIPDGKLEFEKIA